MGKGAKVLVGLGFLPFLGGCSSPQLASIGMHMLKSLFFAVPFVTVVIMLIFLMNKYILHPNGKTNERLCSLVGIVVFPALFVGVLGWKFGYNWISISIAVVLGLGVGWYSYTLDELLLHFWENRRMTVPAASGLLLGGWVCTILFTNVWLEGTMYVTHTACAKRVIVERYTYHYRDSKNGGSYYSWDYHDHAERFALGDGYPELKEGEHYKLGTGAHGKKDQIGGEERYRFIGGHIFSKRQQNWKHFQWLLLSDPTLNFTVGKVQKIQSNFYGRPMHNAGEVTDHVSLPNALHAPGLPIEGELPPATTTFKVVMLGIDFVKMIFTEPEYRDLLYILIAALGMLAALATFSRQMRQPVGIFLLCSLIAPLLIFLVVAARTGSLGGVRTSSRYKGGGGSFGGGGTSGSW